MIAAIVHTGQFSDPTAEAALVEILLKRREKILQTYLPAVNPVVSPRLQDRELTFSNAAVDADVAKAPRQYRAVWFEFDNATDVRRPAGATSSAVTTLAAPDGLPTAPGSYVAVEITADGTEHESWRVPVTAYFRRQADGWKLVGLERLPEERPGRVAAPR